MFNWVSLLPMLLSGGSLFSSTGFTTIANIVNEAVSNDDISTKLKKELPLVVGALSEYGGTFFPQVKVPLQIVAAAMTTFDPSVNKWIQNLLNTQSVALGLPSPNLVVDGFYGQKTMAAARAVQAKLGLAVDGWFGLVSQNALAAVMAKNVVIGGAT